MPWPWNRPKSPFGFADSDAISSGSATTSNANTISNGNTHISPTGKNFGRPQTTTSRSTTPTPASIRSSTSGNNRAASSLGFHHEVQSRSQNPRRHSREVTSNSNPASTVRPASIIPEEQPQNDDRDNSASLVTSGMRPAGRPSTERQPTRSPELLSRPQPSVESLSSLASSSYSDVNNNLLKRSLSAAGSHPSLLHGPLSPSYANGRAFSPTPSVGSISHQIAMTRSQKAIIPTSSRQSTTSEDVCYELPESYEQVNGLNSHEIEERDLRHKAVVDLNPILTHNRTRSNNQSRESMLEAEVARLRKLVDRYKRTSLNASSTSSADHLMIPDVPSASSGSSEAHRVVKVMKVANEHLQKKIDARDAMLADRLAELEQIHNQHAIELEQQRQEYQGQMKQLVRNHEQELQTTIQRTREQVETLKLEVAEMAQSAMAVDEQRENAEKIAILQKELEDLRALEKSKLETYTAMIEEVKTKAAEEMAATKRAFAEAEEEWEIRTEEMRRDLLDERKECDCASKDDTSVVEELKIQHESEIAALKTSIRILEGSRGTTVEQLEEDQRVYRKVSELEASLASKVRALTAERKTSERLRSSLLAAEQAKAEAQLAKEAEKEAHERILLEARSGSDAVRAEERRAVEEEMRATTQKALKDLADQKAKFEAELEIERARVAQLREQHETDAQEFDNRITELIKEHIQEKDRLEATHSVILKNIESKMKEQAALEVSKAKQELEERENSLRTSLEEREAELASAKAGAETALQEQRAAFEKEKEALIAEYQVVINAGDRLRDQDRSVFQSEQERLERLLAETNKEYKSSIARNNTLQEEKLKTAQKQYDSNLAQLKTDHQEELQALRAVLEEAKTQFVTEKRDLEATFQNQLQEAEQQYTLRRNAEKQIEAAKFEEAKAQIERAREEHQEDIGRLKEEIAQTKDRAAKIVSELQQQLKDDEENKQQLLDRVAKAESEKENVEGELSAIKTRFESANTALSEQTDALRKAEAQIKTLNETAVALRSEIEAERRAAAQQLAELRSEMQTREKTANDIHGKLKQEIENVQFELRTANTKLTMGEVELDSFRDAVKEKEEALVNLRNEKDTKRKSMDDEKRALMAKHNQIVEGHLSTIAKLEDTINKMRVRTTEEAKAAEAKVAEQQGLVAQWISSSNRKSEELQRLELAFKEANSKAESFKLDVRAMKNDLKQLEKDNKDQKAEIKSLSRDLKSAHEENASLRRQFESSSGYSSRHARQISDLESRIQALSKEIQDSRNEVSTQKRAVAKRESTIRQLEETLQQRTPRNGRSSPGPNNALASMENGIVPASSSSSNNALQRELRESKAEITRLTEKLDMYETEYRHFFEDHEKLKVEHEEMQKTMQAKIDAATPEVEQLKKAKKELEQRLQSAELRLATSGGLLRRGGVDATGGQTMRSQSSMSYLRHGEISVGSFDD
ncbi:hypothetical protein ABW19_dt0202725 [Dactylella cylindrospora]|nr:hypothetical protein ABW19_dt0202725 [Dactylella cylindrospora]